MAVAKSDPFAEFIQQEVKKYRGVLVPVKASIPERMLFRRMSIDKLHPNPDDEFSMPNIGPNYGIISNYVRSIARQKNLWTDNWDGPIIVEKVRPDGYMILNGHHRWAAAVRMNIRSVPVSIVNLTQETDIEKIIQASTHDKRVTLDLDEVVFCGEGEAAEKKRGGFFGRKDKKSVRLGIPALLHFLTRQGYDIWVYTSGYYSDDFIRNYLKKYRVIVDGVITGMARKTADRKELQEKTEQMVARHYKETLHIANDSIVRIKHGTKDFEDFEVKTDPENWSYTVMSIVKGLE